MLFKNVHLYQVIFLVAKGSSETKLPIGYWQGYWPKECNHGINNQRTGRKIDFYVSHCKYVRFILSLSIVPIRKTLNMFNLQSHLQIQNEQQSILVILVKASFLSPNSQFSNFGAKCELSHLVSGRYSEVLSRVTRIKWLLFLLSISQVWFAQPGPMRTRVVRF